MISGQSLPTSSNTNFAQENHSVMQSTEAPTTTAEIPSSDMPNEQFHAANQMIEIITKLAELRDMGVLTEEEFTKKKTELLNKG
ncbi:SHOCT domain-containing protein [Psychromonas sp. KJ10-2]|uniref:SHOCT domain-containing protein n=1 Tax=Psychromonas sp. KJ10-2 TaxID=3391822 RepID=UPI0039B66DA1